MKGFYGYWVRMIMSLLPETHCFGFKRLLLRLMGATIGKNVRICSSVTFIGSGQLIIGDNTWIGPRCLISASSLIRIGANCDIAPNVYIGNGTHIITPQCERIASIGICKDIVIGDGCWIGVNSTILPGVEIGNKCVVAAGSVVTHSFINNCCLLAGVPAAIKKEISNKNS